MSIGIFQRRCHIETGEEQRSRSWLVRRTNQKSDHDTSVYMESVDGRLPTSLWDWAWACRQCLWIWQSRKLSVISPQGAGRYDGLNAEWMSETRSWHLNTSNTDDWTAACASHHSEAASCNDSVHYSTCTEENKTQWIYLQKVNRKFNPVFLYVCDNHHLFFHSSSFSAFKNPLASWHSVFLEWQTPTVQDDPSQQMWSN